jgi:hypothetical protein
MNDERILCSFVLGEMLTTPNRGIYRIKKENNNHICPMNVILYSANENPLLFPKKTQKH